MIACNMRFHPAHIKTKEIIETGLLGKIILIKTQGSFYYPPDPNAWGLKPEIGGRGVRTDVGIHLVDLLRFFIGEEVVEVTAFADNVVFDYSVEDTGLLLTKFANGAYGFIETCYSAYYTENKFEVLGSKGTLFGEKTIWGNTAPGRLRTFAGKVTRTHDVGFAPPWGQDTSLGGLGSVMKEYYIMPHSNYTGEVEHFSECVAQDKEPEINGMEGLWDLQVVKAAYESVKEGRVIRIAPH